MTLLKMSSATYPHPDQFSTETEPTLDADENRIQYDFDALMSRRRDVFVFVDYLFEDRGTGSLCGAVGTRMRPVHEEEAERQEAIYRDYDESPVAYLYDEQDPTVSWDEWIGSWFRREGLRVIYDPSYQIKYGDIVKDRAHEEGLFDKQDIVFVECIGGGRMFNEVDHDYEQVYDCELQRLVEEAEENGLSDLY